jgi:hypothetical protein
MPDKGKAGNETHSANPLTTGQFFDKTFKRIFGNASHPAM